MYIYIRRWGGGGTPVRVGIFFSLRLLRLSFLSLPCLALPFLFLSYIVYKSTSLKLTMSLPQRRGESARALVSIVHCTYIHVCMCPALHRSALYNVSSRERGEAAGCNSHLAYTFLIAIAIAVAVPST